MDAKKIALIAILSAITIVVAYARGLGLPTLPGLVEFMTVLIFVSGFCFGCVVGGCVGAIAVTIYMLIPYPFAHPAAWLFTISPVLLLVMAILGAMYGVVGGIFGRIRNPAKISTRFIVELAFLGFILTLAYDIFSSIGFYLAYPVYPSVWEAIYLTFIPLYYPYPPIVHTFTNTLLFLILAPALIRAINRFSVYFRTSPSNV
ncbi:MAG: hypothetical protein QXH37_01825 [Candidatus Bathyarchaeia archaeon]